MNDEPNWFDHDSLQLLADNEQQIHTAFVHPPIPVRDHDWQAYRDPEGFVGHGATEQEAIDNLKEQEQMQ
ncbi:hypothetical protein WG922_21405 [Ramlibacter sp. AN1015]|uniref:hypothetical protein n=1 Tax=Ramlibacter sp. AN1015 TaxID=3133428 RepID=UPI0030BA4D96